VKPAWFDLHCRDCPRLGHHLDQVRAAHPDYHARPVPPFGDPAARLLVVGLAPGMHGANRTGRPFTGDFAGVLLYRTLYDLGLASAPDSSGPDDGLQLRDCRITNAVKCLPPANRPETAEVDRCNRYLEAELADLADGAVVLALGQVAHRAVLKAEGRRLSAHPFGHGRVHPLARGRWLVDSYHCSRYNTQTRRLTPEMFQEVFRAALSRMAQ
jgi:uracil-DNA glycosylase family 4